MCNLSIGKYTFSNQTVLQFVAPKTDTFETSSFENQNCIETLFYLQKCKIMLLRSIKHGVKNAMGTFYCLKLDKKEEEL